MHEHDLDAPVIDQLVAHPLARFPDEAAWSTHLDRLGISQLRARFDRIFRRRTGFVTLDRLLARLHARKAELLLVLDRPEIPRHTNGSESDIRCHVTKRQISGGTWSEAGRDARDARLGVPDAPLIPPLPRLIRERLTARPSAPLTARDESRFGTPGTPVADTQTGRSRHPLTATLCSCRPDLPSPGDTTVALGAILC